MQNIHQIYGEQQPLIAQSIATAYNHFARAIETDQNYSLSDDEVPELYNELMLRYFRETMSDDEWRRVTNAINNNE